MPGLEAILNVVYYAAIGILSIAFYMYYIAKRSAEREDEVYRSPYEGNATGRGKIINFNDEQNISV